ncbi:MAG TPA: FAD-dependent oxidoreductase [Halanaerobiales bacterium]|nr:FAD-dependent oxidoreductase [Halanaerobiales bacterium]
MANINLKIDGQEIQAKQGQTILEVAEENGIEIPTLCYHEQLSKTTSCYLCMVKDKNSGNFIPSCSSEIADGMELEASSDEIFEMRQTALNLLLSEHSGDCEAPCSMACPAGLQIEEYLRAARKGDFLETLKIIKDKLPLPMSIGRVCPRFCEEDCRRNVIDDDAVNINDVKRFAADMHYEDYLEELPELTDKKVAIVGAGPAGYTVAYYLRLKGIKTDLYDKMPKPGGMLRYGIPEYRLPKDILDTELAHFDKMGGINVHCNQELGKDIQLENLKEEYDAVALTIGSWTSRSMRTEGEELAEGGIDYLEDIALNDWQREDPGETIIIGGGNTAMDCARSTVRLTENPVHVFYRRTAKQMPAEELELKEAQEEQVNFKFLTQPIKLREENGKKILTCIKMELGEKDASGRRKPIPIDDSEFEVEADTVIAAIGQSTAAPESVPTNRWGDVDAQDDNYHVEDNIFSAGDCVTGPATVVEAIGAGRQTADSIEAFLNGEDYERDYNINVSRGHWQDLSKEELVLVKEPVEKDRATLEYISEEKRVSTFAETNKTLTEEEVKKEAERCIECSCSYKEDCQLKDYSEEYKAHPEAMVGEKIRFDYDMRHPEIIRDPGKCIKCEACIKVCKEVVNEYLLEFKERGYYTKVGTEFNKPLPVDCTECGECIDICPVGALDWKNKKR